MDIKTLKDIISEFIMEEEGSGGVERILILFILIGLGISVR